MGDIGPDKLLLLLIVVLLLFGAKRLPEIGQSLGKGIREFKKSVSGASEALHAPEPDPRERIQRPAPEPAARAEEARPEPKRLIG